MRSQEALDATDFPLNFCVSYLLNMNGLGGAAKWPQIINLRDPRQVGLC